MMQERHPLRLPEYDYSLPGGYFVTVVTHHRRCLFGEVARGEMRLSEIGEMVAATWQSLPNYFNVILDEWIVMPNHFHGIIMIPDDNLSTGRRRGEAAGKFLTPKQATDPPAASPLQTPNGTISGSLGAIMQTFKSMTSRRFHAIAGHSSTPLWQRSYYDHILRSDDDLRLTRQYIQDNPTTWEKDEEYLQ
jgi:putative transposase